MVWGGQVIEAIKEKVPGFADKIFNCDGITLIPEIDTPLITDPSGIKGVIMCRTFKRDHFDLTENIYEDLKDFVIIFPPASLKYL